MSRLFRPLALCVGLRYTRAKRRNHFISFISLTSMFGIALGVTALITVISVMNGFERELRTRILSMASHATIAGIDGPLEDWERLTERARGQPGVVGAAPYVEGEVMITHGTAVRGALLRGVLPGREPEVSDIGAYLVSGSLARLEPGRYRILIGAGLARALGATVGSKVTVIAPRATVTPAGLVPRLRRFTVAGIFEVNHAQFDTAFAVIELSDAQRLLRLGSGVSGIRLKVADLYAAPAISRELARELGGRYWVSDWTQRNANFFRALRTERTVMFVILTLIVAVAAFNIVATLVMVVTDKQADIAILRTLGASPGTVMRIFIVQGTLVGLAGTLAGAAGGIALASNVETLVPLIERIFHTRFLSPEIYYISEVPSQMRWTDVILVSAVAFAMSVGATLYPAWRAARIQPAEALRYE